MRAPAASAACERRVEGESTVDCSPRRRGPRPLLSRELLRYLGPGLRRHHRVHRPRQLGDQHRRRLAVRLPAALGRLAQHADADLPAAHGGAAGHRQRPLAGGQRAPHIPAAAGLAVRRDDRARLRRPPRWPSTSARRWASRCSSTSPSGSARRSRWSLVYLAHPRAAVRQPGARHRRLSRGDRRLLHHRALPRAPGLGRRRRPHWVIPDVGGASILVALGMLGAIVMPHNIYLHSDVILSREWDVPTRRGGGSCSFELVDTTLAWAWAGSSTRR